MVGFGSSSITHQEAKRVIVGVGDMGVSNCKLTLLSCFALGSCVGVAAFDPVTGVGGITHIMLPDSRVSPEKARIQPYLFADTGVRKFVAMLNSMGAQMDSLRFAIVGGASMLSSSDRFRIGEQNVQAVLGVFEALGLEPYWKDLGGLSNRSLHLNFAHAKLTVSIPDETREVSLI